MLLTRPGSNLGMTISQGGVLLFTCSASDPEGLTSPIRLSCRSHYLEAHEQGGMGRIA